MDKFKAIGGLAWCSGCSSAQPIGHVCTKTPSMDTMEMLKVIADLTAKLEAADAEIERRGEIMELVYFALEYYATNAMREQFDAWFDADGKVKPYSPEMKE